MTTTEPRAASRRQCLRQGSATAATVFPILSGENVADIVIENLTLDGNEANNDNLDGNYAGCIFLQDCNRITMRSLAARHYNGDGISCQICHDVLAEGFYSHDHTGLGLHPGSGSQRSIIRRNKLQGNDIGRFLCWGVRFGLAEKNLIEDSRSASISIGHRDTDNVIRDNDMRRSGKVGVLFRPEGKAFGPHRNRLERNRVTDSGPEAGVAIKMQGETEATMLSQNALRETRQSLSRIGNRIAARARNIALRDN
jgi:hypothetical protein